GGALSIQVVTSVNGSGPRWQQLFARLLALNASPGGAADLLAACLFLDRLPAVSGGWAGSL
ncbi:triphosphoribosyl-dephospho-CoA synthase MdcB, partial [Pseudomonas aeruginosa]